MGESETNPRPEPGVQSAEALEAPPAEAESGAAGGSDIAGAPAVATPVHLTPPAATRRSRLRWYAAALVVVAAIGGALAAALVLGAKPLPEALRYIGADSVIVAELRPELPGDQRQHLGNLLAHFPGFADQSTLSEKLDEALDRLVRQATNGEIDYATRVKPLLAGPMTIGLTPTGLADLSAGRPPSGMLLVATTDGTATCQSISGGSATPGETHRGVALSEIVPSTGLACAVEGRFLLLGLPEAIVTGIDNHRDGKGIDGNSTFRTARERLSGDQLALLYVSGKGLTSSLASMAPSLGIRALGSGVPAWVIAGVRVVDDALQVEAITPPVAGPALPSDVPSDPPPATSHFAAMLPADAFGFVETHGAGANLQRVLAQLKADPATSSTVQTLEQALAGVGGIDNLAGWIEDFGVAALPTDTGPSAVILMRGSDAATTKSRLDQLRNLLTIASTGSDISLRTADHNGVSITTVDLGDIGPALESLGLPAGMLPSGAHESFSIAQTGDVLMLGIGDGVLERVVDVNPGTSLATSATYRRAIELGGTPNDIEAFVAIDSLVGWLETNPPAGFDMSGFSANIKPYLEHLAGAIESSVTTATGTRSRIVITAK